MRLHIAWMSFITYVGVAAADPGTIQVRMVDLPANDGQLLCALHDKAGRFPSGGQAAQVVSGTVDHQQGRCDFHSVKPGSYAVSVIHDRNNNGALDTHMFGIPSEPWAVSRDAAAVFRPPTFDEARFDYPGGPMQITVKAQ